MENYYVNTDAQSISGRRHHSNVARPISPDSIGRYRKCLEKHQRKSLELYMQNTLTAYGYNLEFGFQPYPPNLTRYSALAYSFARLILRSTPRKFMRRVLRKQRWM